MVNFSNPVVAFRRHFGTFMFTLSAHILPCWKLQLLALNRREEGALRVRSAAAGNRLLYQRQRSGGKYLHEIIVMHSPRFTAQAVMWNDTQNCVYFSPLLFKYSMLSVKRSHATNRSATSMPLLPVKLTNNRSLYFFLLFGFSHTFCTQHEKTK